MGVFDTVYVDAAVAAALRLHCPKCAAPDTDRSWQTKSLASCMNEYFLRYDDAGVVRLYLLDPPHDRRFWRPWTDEEIAESENASERGSVTGARSQPPEARRSSSTPPERADRRS